MSLIELSEASSGSSLQLNVGDEVLVRLVENPTTGYRWQLSQSGRGELELVEDGFEHSHPGPPAAPGAAGMRRLRFIARKPGAVRLEAVEQRSWQTSGSEQRRAFSLLVR